MRITFVPSGHIISKEEIVPAAFLTPAATTAAEAIPDDLTFTPAYGDTPQTITVTCLDDDAGGDGDGDGGGGCIIRSLFPQELKKNPAQPPPGQNCQFGCDWGKQLQQRKSSLLPWRFPGVFLTFDLLPLSIYKIFFTIDGFRV